MTGLHRLTFQQLQYLQALVEERHVTRAAERMNIGQPAMSAALARMRDVFRDVLLVKTSTGMEPTPRALELVSRIREMTDLLEGRGFADEQFDPSESQLTWKVMASDGIARVVLPELMAIAHKEAPKMRFTVHPGDPRRLSEYLRDGEFDLAMAFVRTPPSELRQMTLYPQRLVCIARLDHPEVKGGVSLKQFCSSDHARWGAPPVVHATMEVLVDEALEVLGESRRVALLVSSLTLLPGVVAQSNLLAVVPEHLAIQSQETLGLQVLPLPFRVPAVHVSMTWHERMQHDPGHKWLRDTLKGIGHELSARVLPTP
jgi:DNA-binding transcriptional LysR family regulator